MLAEKIRNEGLFGIRFQFDKTNDQTLRKCELLQKKSLLYYPLREYRYFYFKYSISVAGFGIQSLNSPYDP